VFGCASPHWSTSPSVVERCPLANATLGPILWGRCPPVNEQLCNAALSLLRPAQLPCLNLNTNAVFARTGMSGHHGKLARTVIPSIRLGSGSPPLRHSGLD
jgi:hypothetical protein